MHTVRCHSCLFEWEYEPPFTRSASCPKCNLDAKVCLNCHFFDVNAYRSCRENQAEWVKEKDRANYCAYFLGSSTKDSSQDLQAEAKNKLSKLFKNQSGFDNDTNSKASLDPKQKLSDLFKK